MNETSASSASGMSLLPDGIATLTAIHFTIIAVVAFLVIVGLLWGIRAKRSRVKASRDVIANAQEAGVTPVPAKPEAAPAPAPAPAPVEDLIPAAARSQVQTRASAAPSLTPIADTQTAGAPTLDTLPELESPPEHQAEHSSEQPSPATARVDASPVITTAPPTEAPAPEPLVSAPATPASYADDPVTQLKGLGPKVATRLAELGVTTIGEMAALSDGEAQSVDAQLGAFTGRMGRDRWIEQARLLAAGDKVGFETKFGKL